MIQDHKGFSLPNNDDLLWRYIDLTKFMSLLTTESLHFTKAIHFDDALEGSRPHKNVMQREEKIGKNSSNIFGKISKSLKSQIAINCWHQNNNESAAMWKVYSEKNQGIAIQTSFNSFKEALNSKFQGDIFVSKVTYIDHKEEELNNSRDDLNPYIHKYESYEYEQEVRALIWPEREGVVKLEESDYGYFLPIKLKALFGKIYLSPKTPKSFYSLIQNIITKYELGNPEEMVKRSDMEIEPLH